MFDWSSAAKLPTTIVARATIQKTGSQCALTEPKAVMNTRIMIANAAAFGPVARNAATGAEAPWYTSGAHTWKGTADTLNANPTNISAADVPTSAMFGIVFGFDNTRRISARLVV